MNYSNIKYKSKFEFTDDEKPPIKIKVKAIVEKEDYFTIKCNEEITSLKEMIYKSFGISPKSQSLVFEGQILEEGKLAKDYNLENGSIIKLILK